MVTFIVLIVVFPNTNFFRINNIGSKSQSQVRLKISKRIPCQWYNGRSMKKINSKTQIFLIGEGRTNELCGRIQIPVQIIKFEPELKSFELIIIPKMTQFKLEGE